MSKRKVEDAVDWESQPCPLCTVDTLPKDEKIQWLACESCRQWYHASCLKVEPSTIASFFCESCARDGKGTTQIRDERPKRAKLGIDYTALDSGQHVNSLRHAYTSLIESRPFGESLAQNIQGAALSKEYLHERGFTKPIIVNQVDGLDMSLPWDLTVDKVAQLVGEETPIEVMDVPTQDEDKGWTLGRWAAFYNEPNPSRVRNVISLEVSNTPLGDLIKRPRIVRELDIVSRYWPRRLQSTGKTPKVQAYCLMSLENSYTDFHVDFAGTSVYYHILQGSKTFLFIPPTPANLNRYSEWCKSSNQSTRFLADECKDTFKVELSKGDTMFIPSGWIHAVHTPQKSLVIGGNFLHLYGMQKHLEIADIEELTKVPGKFRFPYFSKTLWYTAIGILVESETPSPHQIRGIYSLGEFLFKKALLVRDKQGRKSLEDIPWDYMQSSPLLLSKILISHVRQHATTLQVELPDSPMEYSITATDLDACPAAVKTDLTKAKLLQMSPGNESSSQNDEDFVYDLWVAIPADSASPVTLKSDNTDRPVAAAISINGTPVVKAVPISARSPNIYAEKNSYMPPLRTFGPPPVIVPRMRMQQSSNGNDSAKNPTTCFRCKTRKRKCDKLRPCDSCKEAGLADTCSDSGALVRDNSSPVSTVPAPIPIVIPDTKAAWISSAYETDSVAVGPNKGSKKIARSERPIGTRCNRCAKDKRSCGRQHPVCDRCQKKGLKPGECVYSPDARQKSKSSVSSDLINPALQHAQDSVTDQSSSTKSSPEQSFKAIDVSPQDQSISALLQGQQTAPGAPELPAQ